jgi:uncharacterized repeat protein (TIGR03803 family)
MANMQHGFPGNAAWLLLLAVATGGSSARGAETVLYSFQGGKDGAFPFGGLIADKQGDLVGTTYLDGGGYGSVFRLAPDGSETVLYGFKGMPDGALPQGGLAADKAGNFYGTATQGGAGDLGTVFKLAPDGTETTVYAFQGGADGYFPMGGLVADKTGDFYGTTEFGGDTTAGPCAQQGCGTVFEIKPDGSKVVIYAFQGGGDGAYPAGGLIRDTSGNLYGTTSGSQSGGPACPNGATGCGTVFKIAPDGSESVLHGFQGGSDGSEPQAGVMMDARGNLYGTTAYGGSAGADCPNVALGCGTVFRIAHNGTERVLHAFQGGSDGVMPYARLIEDRHENLYGTTVSGGGTGCANHQGCGVVFKLARDGREIVLYAFQGGSDGGMPDAGLFAGKTGALVGTTSQGGSAGDGVVFTLNK